MIELQKLGFSYPDAVGFTDVDLRVETGQAWALIGPNGSGKSSLLKALNGLCRPNAGNYRLDGELVDEAFLKNEAKLKALHKKIGYLFQNSEAQLFCPSVLEEVSFGPRQMGMAEAEADARARDCLKLLGIEPLAERVPYHLSGGEKRKVALAAVLSLNPAILTLDEPMNGIDPRSKRELRELLSTLNAAGKTIICATHDFEYVEGLFSHAAVFSAEHRLTRVGPYAEILADRDFLRANNIV
jgi:cobalt/nickel transport system ATP-binding protein